jgi:hypothetical protein
MPALSPRSPIPRRQLAWADRHERNNVFSGGDEIEVTTGSPGCLPDLGDVRAKGGAIKHFGLGDEVSFWLGLSVKALDCCRTKGRTYKH